jgi:hypothetical protein
MSRATKGGVASRERDSESVYLLWWTAQPVRYGLGDKRRHWLLHTRGMRPLPRRWLFMSRGKVGTPTCRNP